MDNTSYYETEADLDDYLYFIFTDKFAIENHFHKNIEMLFLVKGEVQVNINGKKRTLTQGEGCFIRPYNIHGYVTSSLQETQAFIIIASDKYLADYKSAYYKNKTSVFPTEFLLNKEGNAEIIKLLYLWNNVKKYDVLEAQGWINLILSRIAKLYSLSEEKTDKSENFIINALQYLDKNYANEISLETFAKTMGYSKNYCSTIFNKHLGEGFSSYLNKIRISKAKELLSQGYTADYVFLKVGFRSRATFYRYYKKSKN